MNITVRQWLTYCGLALLGLLAWYGLTYQQMNFASLNVDRDKALQIATQYISSVDDDAGSYRHAVVFKRASASNRYLQRTIGIDGLRNFVDEYNYDLFFWNVKFFKEGEKRSHSVAISSSSGEIISYHRSLEETAEIPDVEKEEALERAVAFLSERFGFDIDQHEQKGDLTTHYDFRKEHSFIWQHKDVAVPWKDDETAGTGKLVTSIAVSGDQILRFSSNAFKVPEDFTRFLAESADVSQNLNLVVQIFYMLLFVASIYYVVSKRNHLAMHVTKKVYMILALGIFLLSIGGFFNQLEAITVSYPTTSPYNAYLIRYFVNALVGALMASVMVLMPGLSGELVHIETLKDRKAGSFLHYVQTTFFSRDVARSILLGYVFFLILLGCQSIMIRLGQAYFGVWVEYSWMTTLTTSYLPFLAGITLGFRASVTEEILYRLFAIGFGKKIFKNTAVAVILSSVLWGCAHSAYPVYPMWFRAVEVSILGIILSVMYLRYGIICVLIAHYVFDAFWHSTGYLFGEVQTGYFAGALLVIGLPLVYALIAFWMNRPVQERQLRWLLNPQQKYNLNVLRTYFQAHHEHFAKLPAEAIKEEVASNGWDFAVVDVAVDEYVAGRGES